MSNGELDDLLNPAANDAGDWTGRRPLWTVTQIAAGMTRAGIPTAPSTVRLWAQQGLLVAEKTSPNGHYRVRADVLRAFLGTATNERAA